MSQSMIGRVWNRLVARNDKESDADCCGTTIEEIPPDETEESSGSCCE